MTEDFGIDLNQVRAFLADRTRRRQERVDQRFAQATRDARAVISEIAVQVNPRRIYQWDPCSIGSGSARYPTWTSRSKA